MVLVVGITGGLIEFPLGWLEGDCCLGGVGLLVDSLMFVFWIFFAAFPLGEF